MASDLLLERTRQADLQPLVVHGSPVHHNLGQIRIELLRELSREHFELFADPNSDAITGDIQWYAQIPGSKRRLADLGADEQVQPRRQLASLVSTIAAHADKLDAAGTESSRAMAQLLRMALEIPDESHIFVVGEHPVLAGWGHVPRGPATPQELLVAFARQALSQGSGLDTGPGPVGPPLPEGSDGDRPPPVTGYLGPSSSDAIPLKRHALVNFDYPLAHAPLRMNWLIPLLWGIFTLLLLAIGHMLLRDCALVWPTAAENGRIILNYCAVPHVSQVATAGQNASLIAELREAERTLEERRRQCVAPVPPPTPTVSPSPTASPVPRPSPSPRPTPTPTDCRADNASDRVRCGGGQIGKVNVILTWNTEDDLDLHVICPSGERIYYSDKQKCGGTLDVDRNASGGIKTTNAVENIVWPSPPNGSYKVEIDPFTVTGSVDYKIDLLIDGQRVGGNTGSISKAQGKRQVFEYTIPYQGAARP